MKTLQDRAAAAVPLDVHETTVHRLDSLPPPEPSSLAPDTPRQSGAESTVWGVTANLVQMASESDGDIHLVLSDRNHPDQQLIAEFPLDDFTTGAPTRLRAAMSQARRALLELNNGQLPPSYPDPTMPLSGTAHLTGIGFFDQPHGQDGDAANSIELHPVLSFRLSHPKPGGHPDKPSRV